MKKKKVITIIVGVIIVFGIIGSFNESDKPTTTDTVKKSSSVETDAKEKDIANTPNTNSSDTDKESPEPATAPSDSELSNILNSTITETAPVMNGFKTEEIGTRAYITIPKDDLKNVTSEQYIDFVNTTVVDSGYNWFTIFCDDGTGICFAGSMGFFAEYGELDEEGSISNTIGYITINENDCSYEPANE